MKGPKPYPQTTSAPAWLYLLACLSLAVGIFAGLGVGSESAVAGWMIFTSGFTGFVVCGFFGAVIVRLTDIRYLAALQVEDKLDALQAAESANGAQPSPSTR
jgi:hypothetical protein